MITSVLLMMQLVVSAKAGFVNYVDGSANVRRQQQVQVGVPVQTQSGSHVELLLSPGSFLRIGENSVVVMDSVDLANIVVRVVSGTAIVDSATLNKDYPIHVTTGDVRVSIASPGVYRFSGGAAVVLNGKLRDDASGTTVKKGQQVTSLSGTAQIEKLESAVSDDLDAWSQERSADLAKANVLAYRDRSASFYNSYADYSTFGIYPLNAAWLYSPFLSGFTFLPFQGYRSYYGYSFVPITNFGFTPFVPAINRPFSRPTANTMANQPIRPVANTAGNQPTRPIGAANAANRPSWGNSGRASGNTSSNAGPMIRSGSGGSSGAVRANSGGGGGGAPVHTGGSGGASSGGSSSGGAGATHSTGGRRP
jgi:hypothetical protein